MTNSFYDLIAKDKDGMTVSFNQFKGCPVIISNVACKCKLTDSNYKAFKELHERYGNQGLKILLFPCNQFLNQDTGCVGDVFGGGDFTVFGRVDVYGSKQHPVFTYLTGKSAWKLFGFVKWNFTKWLINKSGELVKRYGPTDFVSNEDVEKCL